ncbi:Arsenical resistance operon repressor [Actinoplanes sp. SE50]|uniref:ArsR/SmtB family transcription factor n=1 Tax=unclassified Actinoplanes TaxID=2626549 RepID=UPI00023ED347|nr:MULTISPECIES: helix-turn-helix domain-containing protein [unclassified Actinoplanes]AEV81128.1 Arsenical resistance operon repressor [Actinoplanes sp. SE50/110]ATO79529.1 Arsenical resistance operon repressor [Actinoplanes sp. SE50]SLL96930.1 ArsR-family transcriptional regulator [Actinoplanes sp. SE50/110]
MSLGDASLRALAHPVRLRIMSLLTGAELTAADVARALGITHANASYHLRHLSAGGLIAAAGEEKIRGGLAKRYRCTAAQRLTTDVWVDPAAWRAARDRIAEAVRHLRDAAVPPGTPGAIRAVAVIELEPQPGPPDEMGESVP